MIGPIQVKATGATFIQTAVGDFPNGIILTLSPGAGYLGTVKLQEDQGPPGAQNLVDLAWTTVPGAQVPGVGGTQAAGTPIGVSGTAVQCVLPSPRYDVYVTVLVPSVAGTLSVTGSAAPPSPTQMGQTALLSGLTFDKVPVNVPDDLAFQLEAAGAKR